MVLRREGLFTLQFVPLMLTLFLLPSASSSLSSSAAPPSSTTCISMWSPRSKSVRASAALLCFFRTPGPSPPPVLLAAVMMGFSWSTPNEPSLVEVISSVISGSLASRSHLNHVELHVFGSSLSIVLVAAVWFSDSSFTSSSSSSSTESSSHPTLRISAYVRWAASLMSMMLCRWSWSSPTCSLPASLTLSSMSRYPLSSGALKRSLARTTISVQPSSSSTSTKSVSCTNVAKIADPRTTSTSLVWSPP
mmetsp:Transcript_17859/g.41859  ORF Transcript_17859/g.41859 Transcript_17859/m.41859 type:complete len:249 (-) Transcript_17859:79-825(-)